MAECDVYDPATCTIRARLFTARIDVFFLAIETIPPVRAFTDVGFVLTLYARPIDAKVRVTRSIGCIFAGDSRESVSAFTCRTFVILNHADTLV